MVGPAPAPGAPHGPRPAAQTPPRLPYLDGVRGAAALYVVMFHAVLGFAGTSLVGPWRYLRGAMAFGHEAVAVFIVLSGYCLMLPVTRTDAKSQAFDFSSYIGRRAFRILPPYFVAGAATLLLIALAPALSNPHTGTIWDESLPAFDASALLSHLLLVHNWLPSLAYRINGPHWSVATEWQIYFCFPLLLLPVFRRWGMAATCAMAALLGYLPLLLDAKAALVAIPWYLLDFAFGMAAAHITHSTGGTGVELGRRVAWVWLSAGLAGFCLAFGIGLARVWFRFKPVTDVLVGAATATLLVHLTRQTLLQANRSPLLWVLESKLSVGLGRLSYSLYLTHLPVVAACYFALEPRGFSPPLLTTLTVATSLLASLATAYAFHWLVERHFVVPPRRFTRQPGR